MSKIQKNVQKKIWSQERDRFINIHTFRWETCEIILCFNHYNFIWCWPFFSSLEIPSYNVWHAFETLGFTIFKYMDVIPNYITPDQSFQTSSIANITSLLLKLVITQTILQILSCDIMWVLPQQIFQTWTLTTLHLTLLLGFDQNTYAWYIWAMWLQEICITARIVNF